MKTTLRRGCGFTLVEVVVAVTLVALIMAGLLAALRAFGEGGTRVAARIERVDDMRLVSQFLRQLLSEASDAHRHRLPDGGAVLLFDGDDRSVVWLAPMPARHGVGGLHRLRLSLRGSGAARTLVLQLVPFVAAADAGPGVDWSAVPARVLADGIERFAIDYQGLGDPAPVWRSAWHDPVALPARVRLRLVADGRAWPDLVVAVLAAQPVGDLAPASAVSGDG